MHHVVAFAIALAVLGGARADFAPSGHADAGVIGEQVGSSGTRDDLFKTALCWICPTT